MKPIRCPICGKPAQPSLLPFCTPRCATIDLGRWLRADYIVPGPPAEPEPTEAEDG